jgi:hypothetical protein
MDAPTTWMQG